MKQTKQNEHMDADSRAMVTRGEGDSCMGKDGNQISGGEHTVVYTEVKI